MGTAVSRFSWIEWDAGMVIAARATRNFSQSAVAVLIAIYLGLHGFSLVQVGAFLTAGAMGAALAAVVAGGVGDAIGRRPTPVTLSALGALASGMPTLLQRALGLGALASFYPMFVAYAVLAVLTALLYSRLSCRV